MNDPKTYLPGEEAKFGSTWGGRTVLVVQLSWVALCVAWNVAGVYLISGGMRSPGPAASLSAGAILLVIGAVLLLSRTRWPVVYIVVSAITAVMAGGAVINAFVAERALWPSEFWRYAGAVLNGVGMAAALLAIIGTALRARRSA